MACKTCITGKSTRSSDGKFITYRCGARHTVCHVTPAQPPEAKTTAPRTVIKRTFTRQSHDIFTTGDNNE